MRISSRGTVTMSLAGWVIAAPFIAIAWALYWAVVTAVKVTAWLIAALVARLSPVRSSPKPEVPSPRS